MAEFRREWMRCCRLKDWPALDISIARLPNMMGVLPLHTCNKIRDIGIPALPD